MPKNDPADARYGMESQDKPGGRRPAGPNQKRALVSGWLLLALAAVGCALAPATPPSSGEPSAKVAAPAAPTPTPGGEASPTAEPGPFRLPAFTPLPASAAPTAPAPEATPAPTLAPQLTPASAPTLEPAPRPTATPRPTLTPAPATTPTPELVEIPHLVPGQAPAPTPPSTTPATRVVIECIFYKGRVPRSEADEYVQIANTGNLAVDLKGWRLRDESDGYPTFTFPSYLLRPGQRVRVYTNEQHPEWGGFSFGQRSSIWNNTNPDGAALFDAPGQKVSRGTYPPGCG